jgi:O-antigen/teichoic acid export membrane protein
MVPQERVTPRLIRHAGRAHWSALVFLLVFTVVALAAAFYTLRPGAAAAQVASEAGKKHLAVWFRLLVAVLLFILFAGLMLSLRIGRFFFPQPTKPRTETKYVDAWAESGKRVQVPPADDEDAEE